MKWIRLIVVIVSFVSCENQHPLALQLCDCYTQLHRANSDEEINFWGDSCNALHIDIISQLGEDQDEKKLFIKAYRRCQ